MKVAEQYEDEIKRLKELLKEGEIRQTSFANMCDSAQSETVKMKLLLAEISRELGNGYCGYSDSWLPTELQRKITSSINDGLRLHEPTEDELKEKDSRINRLTELLKSARFVLQCTNGEIRNGNFRIQRNKLVEIIETEINDKDLNKQS